MVNEGPRPTLVVDVGGTLLRRPTLGAYRRAVAAVPFTERPAVARVVADAVLTAQTVPEAVAALTVKLALDKSDAARLDAALRADDGEAVILPGALELLDTAREAGWLVVVATNAAAWAPSLPAPLASRVDGVVASSAVGAVKQSPRFWAELRRLVPLDRCTTLVVGDDEDADVSAPRAAGITAVQVGEQCSITEVAEWLRRAGPIPAGAVALAAGQPSRWGDEWVVECPHLAGLVERVTRCRVLAHDGTGARPASVVRRARRAPVLVSDGRSYEPRLVWLTAAVDRRPSVPPSDLSEALAAVGCSLDDLPLHERRHVVSMVREAKDPVTRRSRIEDAVAHLCATERSQEATSP